MEHTSYNYPFLPSLGDRLRYRRRQLSWTQEQLAERANTNQAVIQKIENGKSLRPRKINEIAEALSVSPAWLMFGDRRSPALTDEARALAEQWQSLAQTEREQIRAAVFRLANKQSLAVG